MLLRLSRLSLCLALLATAMAFVGPGAWRGPAGDVALALAATAFLLWRAALAVRARSERVTRPVPATVPLDASAFGEATSLVIADAAVAADFEAALHAVANRLRAELGARSARVFAISERDGVAGLRELVAAQPGFRAPRREVAAGSSPLGRALHERRPCLDLPEAIVLPVLRDGRPLALLELSDVALEFEIEALMGLLSAATTRLAERDDELATDYAAPAARRAALSAGNAPAPFGFAPGRLPC